MTKRRILIFIIFLTILAGFLRFWQIDKIPPGIYPDEAMNANDAIDSLKTNIFKLFYPENNGREGLFIWLISLSFFIFGISIFSLKFVSALFGTLTVLGLYFLIKEVFFENKLLDSKKIALLSSFFLAVSFWHINFSRIAFRAILIPFFLVFGFYFLFKGFRKKQILDLIFSGVLLGLGFYTYISYRFLVILLIPVLFCWFLIYKRQGLQKKYILFGFLLLLAIFITALPIGIYFLKNPEAFLGRAGGVSIFAQGNPLYNFGKSLILHLGMFNFKGDYNWRHNFSGAPQLLWPVGILFLIGLVFSVAKVISAIREKNFSTLNCFSFLISWFVIMLFPGFLSSEGIPHSLRVLGTVPAVYSFAGIGGILTYEKLKAFAQKRQKLLLSCFFAFLLIVTICQFDKYFFKWGKRTEVKNAFSSNYVAVGNFLNSLPDNVKKYVIVNQAGVPVPWPTGIPMPAQTPMFIERTKFKKPRAIYLTPKNLSKIKTDNKKCIIVPLQPDNKLIDKLQTLFPSGKIKKVNGITFYQINQ